MNKQVIKSVNKSHSFLIHPLSRHNCDVQEFCTKQVLSHGFYVFFMPGIPDSDDLSSPKGTCRRNNTEVGDFGLRVTVASGSKPFDDRRCGHAVTDAHGLQAMLRLAALRVGDQLGHQDGAGRAAAGVVPSERICQTIRLPICRFAS